MGVMPRLEDFFEGAAGKVLSAVEADPASSNQHEFNGVSKLVELLGEPPTEGRKFRTTYVYLSDGAEPASVEASSTWYDARARHPARTEYRFYYPGNEVMDLARAGDFVVLARPRSDQQRDLIVIVTDGRSSMAAQLESMFGLEPSERFDIETLPSGMDLTYTSRQLLELLGYEVDLSDDSLLENLIARFGMTFPTTAKFSAYARATLPDVASIEDPDAALLAWWEREEVLFRTFERHVLMAQFSEAGPDIDRILAMSMSAFQRRKSRAGHALENHVAQVLLDWDIPFDAQPRTEGKVRPDFLIPGADAYHDPTFDPALLRMLAVKTTCKDRWRQVISEADRIPVKHLLTLEAPISAAQLNEMAHQGVRLIIPSPLWGEWGIHANILSCREMVDAWRFCT